MCVVDSPWNCFPSVHVSITSLVVMAVWRCRRRWGVVYACWTLLIVVSTLTTKQHYALDILGGMAMAAMVYLIAFHARVD
jgi:membrane-associated phospholipid phosphatase